MADQTTTATELLRQQHDNVKQMFSQFVPAKGEQRSDLFNCIRATLAVHETVEEMVIYPALRSVGEDGNRLADQRLEEESEAKQMLSDLEKLDLDSTDFETKFETFRTAVLEHAQAEETTVFPALESHLSADKLREMAQAIELAERMAPTHPHPHGPESALGNLMVGPVVGIIDRVRDKLSERKSA
jgi:hemerythrin superfamily protein